MGSGIKLRHLTNIKGRSVVNRNLKPTRISEKKGNVIRKAIGEYEPIYGESLVYFVEELGNDSVKIGQSTSGSLRGRIRTLQGSNSSRLHLIGTIPEGGRTESRCHRKFKKYHIQGEWYIIAGELKKFIWEVFYE